MSRFTTILAALALLLLAAALGNGVSNADGHLVRFPDKPSLSQLENRERSQQKNLYHARYVCHHGGGKHKRWACNATTWLERELRETRAVLYPAPRAYVAPHPWHSIAMCESSLGTGSPQWHINTGNGFFGGLQFLTSTWLAYGGGRYAPRADLASPQQQVAVASRMSLSHWPICGAAFR